MQNVFKVVVILVIWILTFFNLNLAFLKGAGGDYCMNQGGDPECERRAESACKGFCSSAGGCEGVFWSGSSWCCPVGSGYCCSLWILICQNWPSWGRFTCIHNDSGCSFK